MGPINTLHYKYWIFILVLVIIAIFSYCYCLDDNLTSMIAFAASIASIILSILAIFMTILSNNSVSGMLHKIRDVHEAVSSIPDNIEQSVSEMKDASTGLATVNANVNKSLVSLGIKLQELDEHISDNNKKLQEYLDEASAGAKTSQTGVKISKQSVEFFLSKMSFNGLVLLYAFFQYGKNKKTDNFSLVEFEKIINSSVDYSFGIMVASTSANVITYYQESNTLFNNISVSEYVTIDRLNIEISKWCENLRKDATNPDFYDLDGIKKRIDDYLAQLK